MGLDGQVCEKGPQQVVHEQTKTLEPPGFNSATPQLCL